MLTAQKFSQVTEDTVSREEYVRGTRYAALFGASMLAFLTLVYVPVVFFSALFGGGFLGLLYLAVQESHRRAAMAAPLERRSVSAAEESWIQVRERKPAARVRRPTLSFRHVGSY